MGKVTRAVIMPRQGRGRQQEVGHIPTHWHGTRHINSLIFLTHINKPRPSNGMLANNDIILTTSLTPPIIIESPDPSCPTNCVATHIGWSVLATLGGFHLCSFLAAAFLHELKGPGPSYPPAGRSQQLLYLLCVCLPCSCTVAIGGGL
jgi:hypothetical protein